MHACMVVVVVVVVVVVWGGEGGGEGGRSCPHAQQHQCYMFLSRVIMVVFFNFSCH